MRSERFRDAFNKLAAAEERFRASEFLAPVVRAGETDIRISGVLNRMSVSPSDFVGFGVFKPTSATAAILVRSASMIEQRAYVQLFPLVRLIVCKRSPQGWLAVAAHRGDGRFRINGMVPILFAEECQQFEVIRARFDGSNFWFESIEPSRDPATAAWLREALRSKTDLSQLDRPGLTPEEKQAYAVPLIEAVGTTAKDNIDSAENKLRTALQHAGAELVDYLERSDGYRVTYQVGDQMHTSAVRKTDLTVQVAGICLSGEDQHFDLASLVGVLREADVGVPRVGDGGIEEDLYWQVHPRRGR